MEQLVQILETQKGIITSVEVRGNTFSVGDDTELGTIRGFFPSGDIIWADFTSGNQFQARLLQKNKTKK